MDVSVIICTYNRSGQLKSALESIEKCVVPEGMQWEVIVVDNNSSDSTKNTVQSFREMNPGRYRYVFENRQGKSFALNTGIEHADGEILAFTDDDVEIDPNWVAEIKSTFEAYPCSAVGGKIIPTWENGMPSWYANPLGQWCIDGNKVGGPIVEYDLGDEPCPILHAPPGANVAIRKTMFNKYGLYREDLGPSKDNPKGKSEDVELCRRLIKGKELFMYSPKAVIYHPVEKARSRKRYFYSFYFHHGRAITNARGVRPNVALVKGIPRYQIRELLGKCLSWIYILHSDERFVRTIDICKFAGELYEYYHMSRKYLFKISSGVKPN